MTKEEAIIRLKGIRSILVITDEAREALSIAIKALEQETKPFSTSEMLPYEYNYTKYKEREGRHEPIR